MNSPLPPGEGQGVRAIDSPRHDPRPASEYPVCPGEGQGVRTTGRSFKLRNPLLLGTLAMLTLIGISLFAVGLVSTNPPDIVGKWQGEDWGQVTLTQTAPGEYAGTYTDTVAKEKGPGTIKLKWSRIEGRFNGTWREGDDDRFGDLSIRLTDNEIRGGLTTDGKSKINPATPRLGDLVWTRASEHAGNALKPVSPEALPFHALQFDGNARSYVNIVHPNGLPTGMSARTLAVWFKLPNVGKVFVEDENKGMSIVGYGLNSPGLRISLWMNRRQIGAETCLTGATGPWTPDANWHHLATVVPEQCRQMGQVLVYLDGVRLPDVVNYTTANPNRTGQTPTAASKRFDTVGHPLKIGGVPTWNFDQAFMGSLSEARIYDRALSSDEIAVLRADPARATDRGLVAGYHFDEGSGSVAHDFSGHGNTGTLKGDVKWVAGWMDFDRKPDPGPHQPEADPPYKASSKKVEVAPETSLGGSAVPQGQNPADSFQARWESLMHVAPTESRGRPMKMSPEEIARFARLPEEQQKAAMIEGIKKIQRPAATCRSALPRAFRKWEIPGSQTARR